MQELIVNEIEIIEQNEGSYFVAGMTNKEFREKINDLKREVLNKYIK